MRARMNMCNIPGNYKNGGDGLCNMCEEEEGSTEHYLNRCSQVQFLRKVWGVNMEFARSQEELTSLNYHSSKYGVKVAYHCSTCVRVKKFLFVKIRRLVTDFRTT